MLQLKIHYPLPTWYSVIVSLKTIPFHWFGGQNGQITLFGKIYLIQYHCTFKDNTISLIPRQKWQIPLFGEIFNKLPLFRKYLAIYRLFETQVWLVTRVYEISSAKICHNGTRWPGIKKYKMSHITRVL